MDKNKLIGLAVAGQHVSGKREKKDFSTYPKSEIVSIEEDGSATGTVISADGKRQQVEGDEFHALCSEHPDKVKHVEPIISVPVPPAALAMQVYTQLVQQAMADLKDERLKEKDMPERMIQIVQNTIDCAVMAAGEAQASIIRVYGAQSMDLDVRRTAEHFAQICQGTAKPTLSVRPK